MNIMIIFITQKQSVFLNSKFINVPLIDILQTQKVITQSVTLSNNLNKQCLTRRFCFSPCIYLYLIISLVLSGKNMCTPGLKYEWGAHSVFINTNLCAGKYVGMGVGSHFFDTSMWVFLNNRASCHSESRPNKFHPSRQFRQTVCSLLGKAQGKNSMPSISDPVNGILLLEDVCVHVWLISPLPPPHGLLLRWPLLFLLSKLWKWAVTALRGLG